MTKTVPAENIGSQEVGYALVSLPSQRMKETITALQGILDQELPNILWPTPPQALHMTLCEIVQPKPYSQDKDTLFELHREQYETVPRHILSAWPAFTLNFDTIEASPHAIIVRARNPAPFNDIRARLLGDMALPTETRTPPDIAHCSIARYTAETDLHEVQTAIERHAINFEEEVTEFKLLRSSVPPLLEYTVLQRYPLA